MNTLQPTLSGAEHSKNWRQRHPRRAKASSRKYKATHKEKLRSDGYKRRHGITYDAFQEKITKQGGLCPIGGHPFIGSGREKFAPSQDHDHATGRLRDVLCNEHNKALGGFHDNETELQQAIDYIRRHRDVRFSQSQSAAYSSIS